MSMSVKDYLMRVYSVRNNIPLKIIEAVIGHQFDEAHKALRNNDSIEISGFGKFIFNKKKALKYLESKYLAIQQLTDSINNPDCTEDLKKIYQNKMEIAHKIISTLKPKIDGLKTNAKNIRGLEEQNTTIRLLEGNDSNSFTGEKINM